MKTLLKLLILLSYYGVFAQTSTVIVPDTAYWKYWDRGLPMPDSTNWKTDTTYNPSAPNNWGYGKAPLGYVEAGVTPTPTTIVGYGGNMSDRYPTTYFRREVTLTGYLDGGDITISHPAAIYKMRVRRDDGIVVYINGHIVYMNQMSFPFGYESWASANAVDNGSQWHEIYIDPHVFHRGKNIIAAEIHQIRPTSGDIWFALELTALNVLPFNQKTAQTSTDYWRVWYPSSQPNDNWKSAYGMDSNWYFAVGEFGFGDGDENNVMNYGPNAANKYRTAYFRKEYNLNTLDDFYKLKFKVDDGFVIYLNGTEVYRDNLNTYDIISYSSLAKEATDDGNVWREIYLPNSYFIAGNNLIAIEVHLSASNDKDLSFNFELVGLKSNSTYSVRGPYLQKATPTTMKILWNTNVATDGLVRYGTNPYILSQTSTTVPSATTHNVALTGLSPNTKYYYSIETSSGAVLERTLDNYFITPPNVGTEKKTRIWAMGCFGSGKLPQRMVQESFLEQIRNDYVDMFLQMGDLAYYNANETDFQTNYFEPYQTYRSMKQTPIYPSLGNHEYGMVNYDYNNLTGLTYYNIFDLFTNAEAGGVASTTERYYSFNYGNIHVVSIDPYGKEAGTNKRVWQYGSTQRAWLKSDLMANTQKWTIILVHSAPYSKGKHDSDNPAPNYPEPEMEGVRTNLVPLFDSTNVDLVLSAHSHNYERSKLIKEHTGKSNTYSAGTHEVSSSSGKYDGSNNSCPYNKQTGFKGTVYAVVGSGGRLETGVSSPWPHPAMAASTDIARQGSYLIEIEGNRMDVKWVSIDATTTTDTSDRYVRDKFTIMKDVNFGNETVTSSNGSSTITLTAPWIGKYLWSNGETTKSITVPATNTNYSVSDGFSNCINKVITINAPCTTGSMSVANTITTGIVKYEVSQTITATNAISNANVKYDAGKSVTLSPGFSVAAGSVFKAYIDGCGNLRVRNEPIKE